MGHGPIAASIHIRLESVPVENLIKVRILRSFTTCKLRFTCFYPVITTTYTVTVCEKVEPPEAIRPLSCSQ